MTCQSIVEMAGSDSLQARIAATAAITLPVGLRPVRATVQWMRNGNTADSVFIENTTGNVIVPGSFVNTSTAFFMPQYDIDEPA